ncbi:hypothetical protein DH2020_033678 [Rehmannia glutinosa]|uniref:Protein kinase domain-containing protein n=1 Tax=Rehmannia glutinosa TaxID=99300 RepID=A0ABR0VBW8_REHGL
MARTGPKGRGRRLSGGGGDYSAIVAFDTERGRIFTEYGDANRYKILEIIGKGSYGVVCAAIDTHTGEKVAIKKITDIFEHNSDAIRILREIKLLRLLRHPDIVEIKRIMMPPSRRDFRDIYVVFELMESDLHQVIKANDDLTHEHHRFFLYQMLRALKYMHTVYTCYRYLEHRMHLCRSLGRKAIVSGKSVVHQLDLITDLLGTPSTDTISGVRNEKARKYLMDMRKKRSVPFAEKFPNADPSALKLLQKLLAFDPKDRPSAEEAISKLEFEFERRRVTKEDIRELIFREILEYHPQLLKDYMARNGGTSFLYPSALGHFKKQFAYLEENAGKSGPVIPPERKHVSLPRSTVNSSTIPPKAQPHVSAFDIRKTAEEAPTVLGVPDAVSGIASKVSRPPPRVPSGIQNSSFSPISVLISPYLFVFCITFSFSVAAKPGRVVGPVLPSRECIMNSQIAIDAKLLQAQSQFVVSGPAAAAHGTVQLGLT